MCVCANHVSHKEENGTYFFTRGNAFMVEINIGRCQIIENPKGCLCKYIVSYHKAKLVHLVKINTEYEICSTDHIYGKYKKMQG